MKRTFILSIFIFFPSVLLSVVTSNAATSCQVTTLLDQGLSDRIDIDLLPTADPNTLKGSGGDFVIESWTASDYTTVTLRGSVGILGPKNSSPLFSVQGKKLEVKDFIGGTIFLDMKSITISCRTK